MKRRNPDLAVRFRRALEKSGHWKKAQAMPAGQRDSYLRGHWQVFERVHGGAA